jgi:hypothetical protein
MIYPQNIISGLLKYIHVFWLVLYKKASYSNRTKIFRLIPFRSIKGNDLAFSE